MKTIFTSLLLLTILLACSKKEEVKLGCDCEGQPRMVLKNALAINYNRGNGGTIGILDPKNLQKGWIISSAIYCNPEVVKGKFKDIDTVYVSGKLRGPCNYGDFNYADRLEVTDIRKK